MAQSEPGYNPEVKISLFTQSRGPYGALQLKPAPHEDEKLSKIEIKSNKNMFSEDFDINNLSKYVSVHYLSNENIDSTTLVKQADDELLCTICCFVNTNPYCLPCTHTFCRDCIDKFENELCPLCRTPFKNYDIISKTDHLKKISSLRFNCTICKREHSIGESCQCIYICIFCTLTIEDKNIQDHLQNNCDDLSTIVKCKPCGKDCFQYHLESHKKYFCSKRLVECIYCEKSFPNENLSHHKSQCKKNDTLPIICRYCNLTFTKKEYNNHSSSCSNKPKGMCARLKNFCCCF